MGKCKGKSRRTAWRVRRRLQPGLVCFARVLQMAYPNGFFELFMIIFLLFFAFETLYFSIAAKRNVSFREVIGMICVHGRPAAISEHLYVH